jgi:hypothetical protein
VDPSALIFVALAVAWAVYLIPKALEHHEEGARTRTVERFSATLRVLGRREPVSRRQARLVRTTSTTSTTTATGATASTAATTGTVTAERTSSRPDPVAPLASPTAAQLRARRQAAARAARRRLRVVTLILVANAVMAALGYLHLVEWRWCAAPVAVLAVWLVACRLMVRRERADLSQARIPAEIPSDKPQDQTEEIARVDAPSVDGGQAEQAPAERDPDSWDPVSVPLPTYVSKPVATRSVTTIDLDSTGVWSSGHNASDSRLAREAEAAERPSSPSESAERRASGA